MSSTPKTKYSRCPRKKIGEITWEIDLLGAGEGIRTLDPNLGKVVLYP
jgi:hypothetical protein